MLLLAFLLDTNSTKCQNCIPCSRLYLIKVQVRYCGLLIWMSFVISVKGLAIIIIIIIIIINISIIIVVFNVCIVYVDVLPSVDRLLRCTKSKPCDINFNYYHFYY